MIAPVVQEPFPYSSFPYRLQFGEKKNPTICWFECEEHLNKYITRHNLNKKDIIVQYRDEKPKRKSKSSIAKSSRT